MKALVIDDSAAMRTLLRRTLQQLGYQVTDAANGQIGLEYLEQGYQPHVVLVDWNMPVMNGLDFIRSVRALPKYRELPIMMVTSETEMSQVIRGLAAGANEYVMKPFTRDVIQEKLELLGVTVA